MHRLALAACLAVPILPAAAADLTLHRVMLSAAGVGYFEFGARVEGPATIGLDVPLDQVDDVLNSLAVFDDHGGVGSIELPGRDTTHQAFADVPFAQAMLDSPASLLASLRGEEVAVSGPDAITGRIVSAVQEPVAAPAGAPPRPAARTRVTLLTPDGFRQFILEDAAGVRPTDPALRARIGAALDAARQQTAASTRHFSLRSTGAGARDISVGYVVAAPLWKATYRLVLPAAAGDKARVQGWAVLENQSGADWKGVDLTLQSGNPVTFRQAIYASYYTDRPDVPVEVLGRILPDADERAVMATAAQRSMQRSRFGLDAPAPRMMPPDASAAEAEPPIEATTMAPPSTTTEATETALDTVFHIPTPVDLARGHTASVPILDETMPAEQLDWLQAGATRPVSAIRLTNASAASLPAGVLTLYTDDPAHGASFAGDAHGASFAGDARLSGLPAGESRLLAFAEDLRTTATRDIAAAPDTLLHVSAANGVLHRSLRHRTVFHVQLTAPPRDPRRVLVDFARMPDVTFSLEGGPVAGQEETEAAWRVPVSLEPGETRRLTAFADRTETTEDALLAGDGDLDGTVLVQIINTGAADEAARAKLQPLFTLRDTVATKRSALSRLTAEQAAATADEERVRNNLRVVAAPGDLHSSLLAALAADETTLATLTPRLSQAQSALQSARAALSDAVTKLDF